MAPEESWVGVEDVAAHLRVAEESIYRWIGYEGFPAHRVGRLLPFKLSEVNEWVQAHGGDGSGSPAPTEKPGPTAPRLPAPQSSGQAGREPAMKRRKR